MSGASAFELLPLPRQQIQGHLNPLEIAVVNLLFIFYEHSHQLDNYYDGVLLNLRELYYVNGDDSVKERFIQVLKQKYNTTDPFKIIIEKLMKIFDFEFVPGYDDAKKRHVVFKQGMSDYFYTTAMNSLKSLYLNRMLLPVSLPESSLPPEVPNEWVKKEEDLMNDMKDEIAAEEAVTAAQSAADLPLPLQDYKKVFRKGIGKLRPLFNHAKVNPGSIVYYDEIKDSFKNALRKVENWGRINRRQSARQSARNKGGRKIKTVRRHTPNKHKKTKSRRV